jgi:hypothetical protein
MMTPFERDLLDGTITSPSGDVERRSDRWMEGGRGGTWSEGGSPLMVAEVGRDTGVEEDG